jgi:hypothetical protein
VRLRFEKCPHHHCNRNAGQIEGDSYGKEKSLNNPGKNTTDPERGIGM